MKAFFPSIVVAKKNSVVDDDEWNGSIEVDPFKSYSRISAAVLQSVATAVTASVIINGKTKKQVGRPRFSP